MEMTGNETSSPDVAGAFSLTSTLPFPVKELGFRSVILFSFRYSICLRSCLPCPVVAVARPLQCIYETIKGSPRKRVARERSNLYFRNPIKHLGQLIFGRAQEYRWTRVPDGQQDFAV